MCGASKHSSLAEEECIHDRPLNDLEYFLDPFLEDKFKPFERTYSLETLSICTNEITQTQFCDEKGDEIVPLCMVNIYIQKLQESNIENALPKTKNNPVNLIHNNEILTWDKVFKRKI